MDTCTKHPGEDTQDVLDGQLEALPGCPTPNTERCSAHHEDDVAFLGGSCGVDTLELEVEVAVVDNTLAQVALDR